jgi:hypothetical protein
LHKSPHSCRICSIAKITFDYLLNWDVEETIIMLVQAVRVDMVDVSHKCKLGFANVKILSAPHDGGDPTWRN